MEKLFEEWTEYALEKDKRSGVSGGKGVWQG